MYIFKYMYVYIYIGIYIYGCVPWLHCRGGLQALTSKEWSRPARYPI